MADQSIQRPPAICYVYEILVDGVVRYVGKGSGRRVRVHKSIARNINAVRAAGKRIRTSDFYNNLAKALRQGREIEHRIVEDGLTEAAAFRAEAARIASLGYGQLWNETPGGDGFSLAQLNDPEAFRRKLLEGVKRSWSNPERRKTASRAATERWKDPAQREQHRAILKESWKSEELLERHRAAFRKRFASHDEMMAYQKWVAIQRGKRFAEKRAAKIAGATNGLLSFGC
jgi:hypothetical protein